jgi:hypothetical protein
MSLPSLAISSLALLVSTGYLRPHEEHDVVARMLKLTFVTASLSSTTNSELYLDLALINRGNQTEIIRNAFVCYSDTKDFVTSYRTSAIRPQDLNLQLPKGEKQVLHLTVDRSAFVGRHMWLGVGVRAIAPNADDIQSIWPVAEISLATDGQSAWLSYDQDKTPIVPVISNKCLSHQKIAPYGP